MGQPAWLGDGFAAALVVVGGYCLARVVVAAPLGRRTHYDVNAGHVLMAVAMAGMLVPRWRVLPDMAWAGLFAALGLWFLARAGLLAARDRRGHLAGSAGPHVRHDAVHGVMALAMVYADVLARAVPTRAGAGMGASTGSPVLTLAFMVVLLASAVWQLNGVDRLSTLHAAGCGALTVASAGAPLGRSPEAPVDRPWLAPRLEVGCHVAMCLAMAYMLVLVL